MHKKISASTLFVVISLLIFTLPALAGGAATVVLDELPRVVRTGEKLKLSFTVWQHGIRLVDNFYEEVDVKPTLFASHQTSGETIQVESRKEVGAAVGHFEVDVTFPRAGVWNWRIEPQPFVLMNEFMPLTVEPALVAVVPVAKNILTQNIARLRPLLDGLGVGLLGSTL
ncbi:MAG: hypothetical protein M3Q45_02695, partial [Chloroflexota bacterium]|nr:hypothetical protein [Chloroflexota bacterium]